MKKRHSARGCYKLLFLLLILDAGQNTFAATAGSLAGILTNIVTNVNIQADSLVPAWQKLSSIVPIVFVVTEQQAPFQGVPFIYKSQACTLKAVLDAYCMTYSDYTYTQDASTGTVWLHPKQISYKDICSNELVISDAEYQMPLLTGVLDILAQNDALNLRISGRRSIFVINAFNYGVDISKGTHTIRDILNMASEYHPADDFYVLKSDRGYSLVAPYNTGHCSIVTPSQYSVLFWHGMLDKRTLSVPSVREIITMLSSPKYLDRKTARGYLEMNSSEDSFRMLFNEAKNS